MSPTFRESPGTRQDYDATAANGDKLKYHEEDVVQAKSNFKDAGNVSRPSRKRHEAEIDEHEEELDEDRIIELRRLKRQRLLDELSKQQESRNQKPSQDVDQSVKHANKEQPVVNQQVETSPNEDSEGSDSDDMFAESVAVEGNKTAKKLDESMLDNWDDHEGYYRIIVGELIGGQYEVRETLGRGVFAAVVRALDSKTNTMVAVKIIRNNETMMKAGFKERDILKTLNQHDPHDQRHVVRLLDSFEHKGHLCLVFENLNSNLRMVLKKFGRDVGINIRAIRSYAQQMLQALALLRDCGFVHADIKPDNILVADDQKLLKLADLGSACSFEDRDITPYLVSRFYRAPELILGLPYDYAVDMWSLACTLYELYQGRILFPGQSNNEMLKLHMRLQGKFSHKLIRKGQYGHTHFNNDFDFVSVEYDKSVDATVTRVLKIVGPTETIKQRLATAEEPGTDSFLLLEQFVDLLDRMLVLNPEKRVTPAKALEHPFFGRG